MIEGKMLIENMVENLNLFAFHETTTNYSLVWIDDTSPLLLESFSHDINVDQRINLLKYNFLKKKN